MKTWAALATCAVACGGGHLRVEVDDHGRSPGWVHAPDATARAITAAGAAAARWGSGAAALDGVTLHVTDTMPDDCLGGTSWGCIVDGDIYVSTYLVTYDSTCIEASSLPHEVGHAIIGDVDHNDPRWRDPAFWSAMAEALRPGVPADDDLCQRRLGPFLVEVNAG